MSSTGTRKERSVQSRVTDALTENDRNFIENLKLFSADTNSIAGLAGGTVNNSPKTPSGNYLARQGDSMIGPLALGPPVDFSIDIDENNTIDISQLNENAQFSSNLQFEDQQPNSFILDIIAGAAFDGQILILRTFGPTDPITIRQGTLDNGGNIQTPDNEDFQMGELDMTFLVFDEALRIEANTGGSWRVYAGESTTGGNPTVLNNLNENNLGTIGFVSQNIDWKIANFHRVIANGDIIFGFTNLPVAGKWQHIVLEVTQDNIGGHEITFDGDGTNFINGNDPVFDENPNAVTTVEFYAYNNGVSPVTAWAFWTTSQTPWVQNVDAAGFALLNLQTVLFEDQTGSFPVATNPAIFYSASNNALVIQTNEDENIWLMSGTSFTSDVLAKLSPFIFDFSLQLGSVFFTQDLFVRGISQFEKNASLNTSTVLGCAPSFKPTENVADPFTGGNLGGNPTGQTCEFGQPWNNLFVKHIRFQDGFTITNNVMISRDDFFNGMVLNVPTGNQINFFEDGDAQFIVGGGFIEVFADMDLNDTALISRAARISFSEVFGAGTPDENNIYTQPLNNFFVFQARANDQIRFLQGDDFISDAFATFTKATIDFNIQPEPSLTQFFAGDTIIHGISNFRKEMVLVTQASPPVGQVNPSFRISENVEEPADGGDLGIQSVPWNNLWVKHARFIDGFVPVNFNVISFDSFFSGMVYNVGTFGFKHIFSASDGTGSGSNEICEFEFSESKFFSPLDMSDNRITTLSDPVNPQDAVNLRFVQENFAISAESGLFAQKVKQTDDTVNNSTTFVEDSELQFNAAENTIYYIEVNGIVDTGTTDVKFALSMPTGSSYRIATGFAEGEWSPSTTVNGGEKVVFTQSTTEPISVNFFIILETGSAEGGVHILFGQESASITDTTLEKGSLMRVYADIDAPSEFSLQENGTKNFTQQWTDDTNFEFFGDFGVQGLGIVLGTIEPVSPTFSKTITQDMLPNGIQNFQNNLLSCFVSLQFRNPDTPNKTLNVKYLINGVEKLSRSETVTANEFGYYIGNSQDFLEIGDDLEIKAWTNTGTSFTLEKVAFFMYPVQMTFKGQSLTHVFNDFNFLAAILPTGITGSQRRLESLNAFELNADIQQLNGPNIGFNAPVALFNDFYSILNFENDIFDTTVDLFNVPGEQHMGQFQVRT